MTLSNTVSGSEEPDVEFVTVPAQGSELREVARKLLDAAGPEAERQVRSLTGGFRVPYAIAKEAGLLGRIAGLDPAAGEVEIPAKLVEGEKPAEGTTAATTEAPAAPAETTTEGSDGAGDVEAEATTEPAAAKAPAKAPAKARAAQS